MSKLQRIIGNVNVNRELILLLVIGGLYSLGIALSNTFVNVYLWRQSGRFIDLGIYNLSVVLLQPAAFILAGRIAKKVDRVVVLRLGVMLLAVFFFTVLFIGDRASGFLVLLGGILGVGYGFYWLAFNVLTFEITEPDTRDFFNGFLGILGSSAGMVGPIGAGFVISHFSSHTGYRLIFTISLLLFMGAVVISFFLKRRPANGSYILLDVINQRKSNTNWKLVTNAHFFQGIREGTFVFIIGVFVFITTGSEFALGTYSLLNSAVAFVSYYAATRIITKNMRKPAILLGGLILYGAIFLLLFDLSYPKLLLYAVLIAIAYPMLLVPYLSITYDVIGKSWNAAKARIEYIVVREIFVNLGRIVSVTAFIAAVTLFDEKKSIPVLLALIGGGHTVIYFFIRRIKLDETNETMQEDGQKLIAESNIVDGENGN
ncbi:MFS transporter [Bacillus lacus]|uniref:MFS transporter n=1 Tax=Metabacillus lacus TaxID=1983721 RepID=A0A7X2IZG8_9BACI|nr:MFS transporter [Metabacillus lacus]MRX72645.1 MFS transporter [Metabacillus lacus]